MAGTIRSFVFGLLCLFNASSTFAQPASAEGQEFLRLYREWTTGFDRLDSVWSGTDPETKGCDSCGKAFIEEVDRKLEQAFSYLTHLVERRGWVSADPWGDEIEDAAIELVAIRMTQTESEGSETAVAFAKAVAPHIRIALDMRDASASSYALIVDTIELFEGRLQVYGTQFDCVGSKFMPYSVLEREKLDERRASIGLGPIANHRYSRNAYLQDNCASEAGQPL